MHSQHIVEENTVSQCPFSDLCSSFAEKAVLCHFIILAILWLTRDLGTVGGWGKLIQPGYVGLFITGS